MPNMLPEGVAGDVGQLPMRLPSISAPTEDVSAGLPCGMTPLMAAAASGNEPMVKLLLLFGADPAQRDAEGRTAALPACGGTVEATAHAAVAALLRW